MNEAKSILQFFHLWWVPILSAVIWWSMLITLMSLWASEGFPKYYADSKPDQSILYISDIAAGKYKIIFIVGSASQGVLFVLSGASELFLRCTGRLRRHYHTWGLWCTNFSLLFAIVGQLGILFVAIFDTRRYPDTHMSMLVVYIVFIGVSALFNVGAYYGLGRTYMTHRVHISLWMKIVWFFIECSLAIAFVASQSAYKNVPAILEWVVSFIYPFFQLIVAYDIWPAIGKKHGYYPKRIATIKSTTFRASYGDRPTITFEELCDATLEYSNTELHGQCGIIAKNTSDSSEHDAKSDVSSSHQSSILDYENIKIENVYINPASPSGFKAT